MRLSRLKNVSSFKNMSIEPEAPMVKPNNE